MDFGTLTLYRRGEQPQPFRLRLGSLSIGSDPSADIGIEDALLDRFHARVVCTPAGCQLTDLDSKNGTVVNKERLRPHAPRLLRDGDRIQLGRVGLLYTAPPAAKPPPRSSTPADHVGQPGPIEGQPGPIEGQPGPIEGQPRPIEGQTDPIEGQTGPIEGQTGPIEGQPRPIEGQPRPIEGQTGPIEGQTDPIEGQTGPIEGQTGPIEGQPRPIEGQPRPIEGQPRPIEGQTGPIEGQPRPIEGQTGPIEGQTGPIDRTAGARTTHTVQAPTVQAPTVQAPTVQAERTATVAPLDDWNALFQVPIVPAGGQAAPMLPGNRRRRRPRHDERDLPYEAEDYLALLPPIYHDDRFLRRFLLIFKSVLDPLDRQIGQIAHYFDPRTAPEHMLPWLAGWVDLVLDERWPEARRRELIGAAAVLYRWRGTRRGLSDYLRIYTGVTPRIVEQGQEERGEPALPPHTFRVIIEGPGLAEVDRALVERIIELEKPAHSAYQLELRATGAG